MFRLISRSSSDLHSRLGHWCCVHIVIPVCTEHKWLGLLCRPEDDWHIYLILLYKPFVIQHLPKSFNMSCSNSLDPKLYLDLWPHSQNALHKRISWILTVDYFVILIPLCQKCWRNYSAYFGNNMTCCTQEKYSSNTWGNCYFCTGTTLLMEGGIRLRFWEMWPQHMIMWQFITDMWSCQHIIFTFYYSV